MENEQHSDAAELRKKLGFITDVELFQLLGISVGTGRNRQSNGTLPPVYKLGKAKLFKVSEVDAWIRRRRVTRGAP